MAVLVARQGRELQRYSQSTGGRIVVGCIPYRVRACDGELEVLVITSQKGHGMMFPKGGWEVDESMDEAARREALEEAGVLGDTEPVLGFWHYKSRRYVDQTYEGFMFPLRVADELHQWPEMASRKRTWATVQQVMDGCPHWWMREALERLVARHAVLCSLLSDRPSSIGATKRRRGARRSRRLRRERTGSARATTVASVCARHGSLSVQRQAGRSAPVAFRGSDLVALTGESTAHRTA